MRRKITTEKQLRAAKPNNWTPKDSPAQSPEARALHAMQYYLKGHVKNDAPALFMLMTSLDLLADEGVLAPKLVEALARGICQSFAQPDRPPPKKAKTTTTVMISLEIKGDTDDAFQVVDEILDKGILQDAINYYDGDVGSDLEVVSAVSL